MKTKTRLIILTVLILLISLLPVAYAFDWQTTTPESQGMDSAKLASMWNNLQARNTNVLLIIRNEKIVYENYVSWYRTKKHHTASLAKALVGGVALSLAMHDGLISPSDYASKYVTDWVGVSKKKDIRVKHLATHTSGIEDADPGDEPGWKANFWARYAPPNDPFTISRDKAPVLFAPGTSEHYSNPGMAMLGYCITAAIKNSKYKDLRSLLKYRVMQAIGVPSTEWSCGYSSTFNVDGLPLIATWGGGKYSPNATARVGRLMLRKGNWEGTQIIKESVVEEVLKNPGLPNNHGLGWWINRNASGTKYTESLPADAFWGSGAGNQHLLVIPSLNIILVRYGEFIDPNIIWRCGWYGAVQYIFKPLMGAITTNVPAAPSPPSGLHILPARQ